MKKLYVIHKVINFYKDCHIIEVDSSKEKLEYMFDLMVGNFYDEEPEDGTYLTLEEFTLEEDLFNKFIKEENRDELRTYLLKNSSVENILKMS